MAIKIDCGHCTKHKIMRKRNATFNNCNEFEAIEFSYNNIERSYVAEVLNKIQKKLDDVKECINKNNDQIIL